MTEAELRMKYVNTLLGWVGLRESNGSHRKIIDIYNSIRPLPSGYAVKYTDAWCATTVSAAAIVCGLTEIIPCECSCPRQITLWQKMNRWMENDAYSPQPGDVVYYAWSDNGVGDCTKTSDHVGVVVWNDGLNMRVVEGNYSDSVKERILKVNGRYIRGYGLPDFAGFAKKTNSGATSSPSEPVVSNPAPTTPVSPKTTAKYETAHGFNKSYARVYTVTASSLNIRHGAGTDKKILGALSRGTKVQNFGYFNSVNGSVWLLVVADGITGYVSRAYLK